MKAEERHKLERNALADWIGQTITDIKPYSRAIFTAVVLLLLAIVAAVVWPKIRDRASDSAWQTFYTATASGSLAQLEGIAEEYPGTPVANWALVLAADARLANACQQLFTDKAAAAPELRKAIEQYSTVIAQSREPELRERALFGRARAYEAVSGTQQAEGDLPKAIADYEQVAEKWPDGPFTPMAQEQAKRLKSPATKAFYDKFAAYTPKRPVSKALEDAGKQLPFDTSSLPDEGPAELSKMLNLGDLKVKGATGTEKGNEGKGDAEKKQAVNPEAPKPEPPKAESPKLAPAKTEPPKATTPAPAPAPAKSEPPKK